MLTQILALTRFLLKGMWPLQIHDDKKVMKEINIRGKGDLYGLITDGERDYIIIFVLQLFTSIYLRTI